MLSAIRVFMPRQKYMKRPCGFVNVTFEGFLTKGLFVRICQETGGARCSRDHRRSLDYISRYISPIPSSRLEMRALSTFPIVLAFSIASRGKKGHGRRWTTATVYVKYIGRWPLPR